MPELPPLTPDAGLPSRAERFRPFGVVSVAGVWLLRTPILLYRYTLSMFLGRSCRYLPTCSAYALEAIDRNGAWRGFWLTTARCCRCHPFERLGAGSGFDPVPDVRAERHRWAPWRYGRWRMP